MTDSNENLDRKIEFIADAMGHLTARMDKLAESQDLLVRSILLREEGARVPKKSARLLEESTRLVERVDQFCQAVSRREQYRRNAASLRGFLLWEDAT